ncbi:MAG: FKBP-type peptidyl-prolyl cis-trans isomerase [Mariprofundaceae bacterium]
MSNILFVITVIAAGIFIYACSNAGAGSKELAMANMQAGKTFLEENRQKEGVIVTESGLQYLILKSVDGNKPTARSKVKVHYQGTHLDGTEFDSSYARGEPAVFPLNGVIKGWTEGVQLMGVGSKFRFFVPSGLAYGKGGPGPIGPNATLIFDVELLEIIK